MRDLDLDRLVPGELARLEAYDPPEGGQPIKLDANESPFPPPPGIAEEIRKLPLLADWNRYPDPASRQLRRAFARRFGCSDANVLVGNGSDELISLLLWTLRGRADDGKPSIVLPSPTFAMYGIGARGAGYRVREVPLGKELEPDVDGLCRSIEEADPHLVFISNPNNPTGTLFSSVQVRHIVERTRGLVVLDEAYGDFGPEPSLVPEAAREGNLAVLRTLSKVGGAALRCGFLVTGTRLLEQINKVRAPFNVSWFTQAAARLYLDSYPLVLEQAGQIVLERDRLAGRLAKAGVRVFPSAGNFLLVTCRGRERELWTFLHQGGIMVKFLSRLPVVGDSLRITVGSQENNDALIKRVSGFMEKGGQDEDR